MALTDQPYLPLYVNDWMSNAKLRACSVVARGVMIDVMCLMHKSDTYGRLKLLGKFAGDGRGDIASAFAKMIARLSSMSGEEASGGLQELLEIGALEIEEKNDKKIEKKEEKNGGKNDEKNGETETFFLVCRRMVRDVKTSKARSRAGKRGMASRYTDDFCYNKSTNKQLTKGLTNTQQNTENENINENENNLLSFDLDSEGGVGGEPPPGQAGGEAPKTEAPKTEARKAEAPKAKPKPAGFEPPGHLADMWPDYLAVRKAKKAAPTMRAFEGIVQELKKLAPGDNEMQRAILDQSIRSGWVDVYELKNKGGGYGRGSSSGGADRFAGRFSGLV